MYSIKDAQTLGVCYHCETDIKGKLTRLDMETYKQTGLCPECWGDSIRTKGKMQRPPAQISLPIDGDIPKSLLMSSMTFGQLVMFRSNLLAGAKVHPIDKGPVCTFLVIVATEEKAHEIGEFIRGRIS